MCTEWGALPQLQAREQAGGTSAAQGPGPLDRLTSWALPPPCWRPEAKSWGTACRDRNSSGPLSLSQHCKQASQAAGFLKRCPQRTAPASPLPRVLTRTEPVAENSGARRGQGRSPLPGLCLRGKAETVQRPAEALLAPNWMPRVAPHARPGAGLSGLAGGAPQPRVPLNCQASQGRSNTPALGVHSFHLKPTLIPMRRTSCPPS